MTSRVRSNRRTAPWLALASIVLGGAVALALAIAQASAFDAIDAAVHARDALERFAAAAAATDAARGDAERTGAPADLALWRRDAGTLRDARAELRQALATAAVRDANAERLLRNVDALLADPISTPNRSRGGEIAPRAPEPQRTEASSPSFERGLRDVRSAIVATHRARASRYSTMQGALVVTLCLVLALAVCLAVATHGFDVRAVRRWNRRENVWQAREKRRVDEYEIAHAALADLERTMSHEATELRRVADVDSMTGLLNRRGFESAVASLLERAMARDEEAAIVFCDMDGLKSINDRLGHDMGDAALRDTAALLRDAARASDLVARIGGDEFVVAVERGGEAPACAFEDRLRRAVAERNLRANRPYRVSISVGHAIFDPRVPSTVPSLLSRADARMYEAKERRKGDERADANRT